MGSHLQYHDPCLLMLDFLLLQHIMIDLIGQDDDKHRDRRQGQGDVK